MLFALLGTFLSFLLYATFIAKGVNAERLSTDICWVECWAPFSTSFSWVGKCHIELRSLACFFCLSAMTLVTSSHPIYILWVPEALPRTLSLAALPPPSCDMFLSRHREDCPPVSNVNTLMGPGSNITPPPYLRWELPGSIPIWKGISVVYAHWRSASDPL